MKFKLYENSEKSWPNGTGTECLHCGRSVKVSEPAIAARSTVRGTIGFHLDCIRELGELEPIATRYEQIEQKISATSGDPFGFKERNGYV